METYVYYVLAAETNCMQPLYNIASTCLHNNIFLPPICNMQYTTIYYNILCHIPGLLARHSNSLVVFENNLYGNSELEMSVANIYYSHPLKPQLCPLLSAESAL